MHNIAAKTCLFVSSLALLQERNCFLYGLVKPRFTRGDPVTLPGLRVIFDPSYAHPSKAVLTRGYTPVGTALLLLVQDSCKILPLETLLVMASRRLVDQFVRPSFPSRTLTLDADERKHRLARSRTGPLSVAPVGHVRAVQPLIDPTPVRFRRKV